MIALVAFHFEPWDELLLKFRRQRTIRSYGKELHSLNVPSQS
jgi:hypothetical protein